MQAETVYSVAQALPETEKLRLLNMLEKDLKAAPVEVKETKSAVWTHEECYDIVYKLLMDRKRKNNGHKLSIV